MMKQMILLILICCHTSLSQTTSARWYNRSFVTKIVDNATSLGPFRTRYDRKETLSTSRNIEFNNRQARHHSSDNIKVTDVPFYNRIVSTSFDRNQAGKISNKVKWRILQPIRRNPEKSGDIEKLTEAKGCVETVSGQRCLSNTRSNQINSVRNAENALRRRLKKERDLLIPKILTDVVHSPKRNTADTLEKTKPTDETKKLSTRIGSNSCACYWKQEKCGCDCEGSLNFDDFQELARSFFSCHNFTFTMTGGDHYALPPNLFSKLNSVQEFNLFIRNSTFEYICDPTPMTSPFKGVTFARNAIIKLSNVSVRRGWNWKPFEQLQSSTDAQVSVVLEDCKLRRLTSDFANLAKGFVDTVDISNSNLQMIGSNAFVTFGNMTHFRVPSNKIQQLRRTDFPELLPRLEELDLRHNKLSYLDNDLFSNMPNLKEILLTGNPMTVLPERTFQDIIGQANLVGISDISLTCDCHLQWLKDSMMHDDTARKNLKGAICRRPPYLRGMPLDNLSKEHLLCL